MQCHCSSHFPNKTMAKDKRRSSDHSSSSSAAGKGTGHSKKKSKQKVANWGDFENQKFAELVDNGTLDLTAPLTNAVIDPIAERHFGGRSLRSVREHLKDLAAQYRLEEDLAGGRIPAGKSYDLGFLLSSIDESCYLPVSRCYVSRRTRERGRRRRGGY